MKTRSKDIKALQVFVVLDKFTSLSPLCCAVIIPQLMLD